MSSPMHRHPDVDELADLAAGVLRADQAQDVASHVHGCEACAALLSEAEGLRSLLLADDAGPMPDEVWTRLEAALQGLAPGTGAQEGTALPGDDGGYALRGLTTAVGGPGKGPRLRRPASGPQRTRRQVRSEDRDGAPSRVGPFLAVAAGVIVLLGGAGVMVQSLLPATDASDTSAGMAYESATAEAGTTQEADQRTNALGVARPLVATGTDYTAAEVATQVQTLLSVADAAAGASADSPSPSPSAADGPSAIDVASSTLADPEGLRECLGALDAAEVQPLAVDLALWEGRPAAIIVLPARDGGYEVWAVARDCRAGADGTVHFEAVAP